MCLLAARVKKRLLLDFHIRPDSNAVNIAEREGVENSAVYHYFIMCLMIFRSAAEGLLAPTIKETGLRPCRSSAIVFPFQRWETIAGLLCQ